MLVMDQLASILLDVQPLDPDDLRLAIGRLDLDRALADQRVIKLADLIAGGKVGVEIVLPVEPRPRVDLRTQRHAGAHRLANALAVHHRQHAGHGRVDQADLVVRLGAERRRCAGEQLGLGGDLGMDLEADDDLPFPAHAVNAIGAHLTTISLGGR